MGQQISYLTVIVVHSTMHLMDHNHCQITTICTLYMYMYIIISNSYLTVIVVH